LGWEDIHTTPLQNLHHTINCAGEIDKAMGT